MGSERENGWREGNREAEEGEGQMIFICEIMNMLINWLDDCMLHYSPNQIIFYNIERED